MGNFFSSEGPLFQFLDKMGHLILLSLLWIFCCIPLVTVIPATTAFYYATVKSIRRGHGYPLKEFLGSFKNNLKKGIPLSAAWLAVAALLLFNIRTMWASETQYGLVMSLIYLILIFYSIGFLVYICPVLSRFSIRTGRLVKMASIMVFRHLPVTILLSAGTGGCGILAYSAFRAVTSEEDVMPLIALLLLLPGIWCYVSTFLVEPVLKKYMPPPKEGESAWYYE